MIKKNANIISLILLISFLFLFYLIYTFSNSLSINNPFYIKIEELKSSFSSSEIIRNEEWEQMNENVFFKRTGAFYIIEKRLLRIFFIAKIGFKYRFDIRLNIQYNHHLISSILFNNVSIKNHDRMGYYTSDSLNLNIDLVDYVNTDDYDLLINESIYKFSLNIYNTNDKNEQTKYPIKLNLRYIRKREKFKKSGSIICSKCLFYEINEYKELLWWVELNINSGYKKMVFCNISIPNTNNFNKIFENYKDFIELRQFKYIPNLAEANLTKESHQYLSHYFEIKQKNGNYHKSSRNMFDLIIEKECFFNNAAQYEYIAINDNDETILPRVNAKVLKNSDNFDYVESLSSIDESSLNLEMYCERNLEKRLDPYFAKVNNYTNLYFKMGFYLSDIVVKEIFYAFEIYFNSNKFNSSTNQHRIDNLVLESNRNVNNYTFLISGKEEIKYAINLLNIYKYYIKNLYQKHVNMSHFSKKFGSLFYLAGRPVTNFLGKTVYNTEIGLDLSVHYAPDSKSKTIAYDDGHSAHFRYGFEINNRWSRNKKDISIRELVFDLNYFNCFYKQIVDSIKNF